MPAEEAVLAQGQKARPTQAATMRAPQLAAAAQLQGSASSDVVAPSMSAPAVLDEVSAAEPTVPQALAGRSSEAG